MWTPGYWGKFLKGKCADSPASQEGYAFHPLLHTLGFQWAGKCSPVGSASRIKLENARMISSSYHRRPFLCGCLRTDPICEYKWKTQAQLSFCALETRLPITLPPGTVSASGGSPLPPPLSRWASTGGWGAALGSSQNGVVHASMPGLTYVEITWSS